jgi:hypothetical protein
VIHHENAHNLLAPNDVPTHLAAYHPDGVAGAIQRVGQHRTGLPDGFAGAIEWQALMPWACTRAQLWGIDLTDFTPEEVVCVILHESEHRAEGKTQTIEEGRALADRGPDVWESPLFSVGD